MHNFFHGWRRKAGIVTLLMALVVSGGWIRSFLVYDSFGWANSAPALPMWFVSVSGTCGIIAEIPIAWNTFDSSRLIWETEKSVPLDELLPEDTKWSFQWGGFGYARNKFQFFTFPYWSIAVPLTLLSAYLLLVPSRKRLPSASQSHA
ncbi:MAG: hypothetical protein JWP89_3636 [Schlesneria sp.]|nr:hypothetical protein [Schlesneria sp.]